MRKLSRRQKRIGGQLLAMVIALLANLTLLPGLLIKGKVFG